MTLVLLAAVVALFVVFLRQVSVTRNALATTCVESHHPPREAAELVHRAFSGARNTLWTRADGPGRINMRRVGKSGGIVMSINIEALPDGGSATNMWASSYREYFFVLAGFAGAVNSRKNTITQLLSS